MKQRQRLTQRGSPLNVLDIAHGTCFFAIFFAAQDAYGWTAWLIVGLVVYLATDLAIYLRDDR